MFRRILVAIDHSDSRCPVFEQAVAIAKSMTAKLRFVYVLTSTELDFPQYPLAQTDVGFVLDQEVYNELLQHYAQERQAFENNYLNLLRDTAQDALQEGISADYQMMYGSPGKQICQMAEDWQADAIVLGRRGNLGLKELWLGSVSNYVVHHAPCSVLVVQGTEVAELENQSVADLAHA
jgi:nucleotide-binding universal stress UspA family protein